MKRTIRITESDLHKYIKKIISEGPFDEINFDFMDREDQEREDLKILASETLYNNLANDPSILREIYRLFLESSDVFSVITKFKDSQYMNRVENFMEEIYKDSKFKKVLGERELTGIFHKTFHKFLHDAYNKSKQRYDRIQGLGS